MSVNIIDIYQNVAFIESYLLFYILHDKPFDVHNITTISQLSLNLVTTIIVLVDVRRTRYWCIRIHIITQCT